MYLKSNNLTTQLFYKLRDLHLRSCWINKVLIGDALFLIRKKGILKPWTELDILNARPEYEYNGKEQNGWNHLAV